MARTQRPTNTWLCSNGVHLQVTALRADQPLLARCWWPLHRVSRAAFHAALPWPVHLDEFRLVGFHDRARSPGLWVYVHARTGAEIFVDDEGQTYRNARIRSDPIRGRFRACTVRAAAEGAGLHLPQARARTEAAPLPPGSAFDGGPHISEPTALRPGRRLDAMRRARAITRWDPDLPPIEPTEPSGPTDVPRRRRPSSFLNVLPGPPRTRDFAERWEPRLLMDSPSSQVALDAMEAKLLDEDQKRTSRVEPSPPSGARAPSAPPAAVRAHPSTGQAARPSRKETSPNTARPTASTSMPHLRQVWPPPTRPRRWPGT